MITGVTLGQYLTDAANSRGMVLAFDKRKTKNEPFTGSAIPIDALEEVAQRIRGDMRALPAFDDEDLADTAVDRLLSTYGVKLHYGEDDHIPGWGFSWKFGFIFLGFMPETFARTMAALWINLWLRGCTASMASEIVDTYVAREFDE